MGRVQIAYLLALRRGLGRVVLFVFVWVVCTMDVVPRSARVFYYQLRIHGARRYLVEVYSSL